MKGWVVADHAGRSYLVRAGVGTVTAVVPVGLPDGEGRFQFYRVELDLPRPANGPRAIRYSTSGRVAADDPMFAVARSCEETGDEVSWAIAWHRHDWVPGSILITSLDLATDADARVMSLDPIENASSDAAAVTRRAGA
mgnify:CR=1 FL=1